ncbi:hypothetical protein [Rhizobacter sp. LjRoot28]|jgi:hypothetical protein|uniref:hypothetical protein n=1 Tax=Rhizobacter sp. LjRoot28 TaxID=3342309 RepID=UPI003ED103AA
MSAQELRACLQALRALRADEASASQARADIVEHVVLWGFASLVADGNGGHADLAREILDGLAADPVARFGADDCITLMRNQRV